MKQQKEPLGRNRKAQKEISLNPMVVIPLIVVVLMVIIVIADHGKTENSSDRREQQETEVSAPSGEAETETMAASGESGTLDETESSAAETETEPEPGDPFETDSLKRDSVPEILELMKRYFAARATADAETMEQVYGRTEVSEEELTALREGMLNNSRYVQDFEDITTYVMQGTTGDAWLVYTLAEIRFHSVSTTAPMIMWCYVRQNGEGTFYIEDAEAFSENVQQFIDVANHSEAVRRLASDVNVRLKEVLTSDADLNEVYGVLRDGSPVWQNGEEDQPIVVVGDGDETTGAADETSAETVTDSTEDTGTGTMAGTEAETEAEITAATAE